MEDNEKLFELNEKIDLLLSQTNAEYLSDYQMRTLLYQIDNLTIKRDLLQNKINRQENTQEIDKLDIILLHISYILYILFILYLLYKVVSKS